MCNQEIHDSFHMKSKSQRYYSINDMTAHPLLKIIQCQIIGVKDRKYLQVKCVTHLVPVQTSVFSNAVQHTDLIPCSVCPRLFPKIE